MNPPSRFDTRFDARFDTAVEPTFDVHLHDDWRMCGTRRERDQERDGDRPVPCHAAAGDRDTLDALRERSDSIDLAGYGARLLAAHVLGA